MHDGVVADGVEDLSHGVDDGDAHLLQNAGELVEDHLHALFVDVLLVPGLAHRPLQVVVDLQELGDSVGLGVLIDALLLLGGALAVVVVLSGQAQVLVVERRHLPGQLLHFFHLLPGDGEGLPGVLLTVLLGDLARLFLGRLAVQGGVFVFLAHDMSSSFGGN